MQRQGRPFEAKVDTGMSQPFSPIRNPRAASQAHRSSAASSSSNILPPINSLQATGGKKVVTGGQSLTASRQSGGYVAVSMAPPNASLTPLNVEGPKHVQRGRAPAATNYKQATGLDIKSLGNSGGTGATSSMRNNSYFNGGLSVEVGSDYSPTPSNSKAKGFGHQSSVIPSSNSTAATADSSIYSDGVPSPSVNNSSFSGRAKGKPSKRAAANEASALVTSKSEQQIVNSSSSSSSSNAIYRLAQDSSLAANASNPPSNLFGESVALRDKSKQQQMQGSRSLVSLVKESFEDPKDGKGGQQTSSSQSKAAAIIAAANPSNVSSTISSANGEATNSGLPPKHRQQPQQQQQQQQQQQHDQQQQLQQHLGHIIPLKPLVPPPPLLFGNANAVSDSSLHHNNNSNSSVSYVINSARKSINGTTAAADGHNHVSSGKTAAANDNTYANHVNNSGGDSARSRAEQQQQQHKEQQKDQQQQQQQLQQNQQLQPQRRKSKESISHISSETSNVSNSNVHSANTTTQLPKLTGGNQSQSVGIAEREREAHVQSSSTANTSKQQQHPQQVQMPPFNGRPISPQSSRIIRPARYEQLVQIGHTIDEMRAFLTTAEQSEIKEFPGTLYYLGLKSSKIVPRSAIIPPQQQQQPQQPQKGVNYDDDSGSYVATNKGDHIAYRYAIKHELGAGSFGSVLCCHDHKHGVDVAVKVIRSQHKFTVQAQTELKILNLLNKEDSLRDRAHCIKLLGSFTFRGHVCFSFPLYGLNLYDYLKANNFKGVSYRFVRKLAYQLFEHLDFLRSKNIVHLDLKPENILLQDEASVKIVVIDFGSSCMSNQNPFTYVQSRFYRSPEVLLGNPYGVEVDMWSVACILPEMRSSVPIFPGRDEVDQLGCIIECLGMPPVEMVDKGGRKNRFFDSRDRLLKGKQKSSHQSASKEPEASSRIPGSKSIGQLSKAKSTPDDLHMVSLLSACFKWNPSERLTPQQAMQHPWFHAATASTQQS